LILLLSIDNRDFPSKFKPIGALVQEIAAVGCLLASGGDVKLDRDPQRPGNATPAAVADGMRMAGKNFSF
jgi:hypothetical protein